MPLLCIARERLQQRRIERRGKAGNDRTRRHHGIAEDLRERLALRLALEESLARERLPHHDARSVDVDGSRHVTAGELLRRHVRELALDLTVSRDLDASGRLRDAEVEHTRNAVGADENVLR